MSDRIYTENRIGKGLITMTNTELAKLAFEEACDPASTVRYGVKQGNPFWNLESIMFMYVPAFHFTALKGWKRYRYDALDENGVIHSFESNDCCSLLTPIWRDLPMEGVIRLTVTAICEDGSDYAVVGSRTFFKHCPFPGDTPKAARPYKEAAAKAYRYAMAQPFIKHWLEHGTPDPYYDLNIYPSKMISALVQAMISYAKVSPEDKKDAMTVAVSAADYLMRITKREGPLANLPPTYYPDFCPDPDKYGIKTPNYDNARQRFGTMMMIYPASAGSMYVALEKATSDEKYLEEAKKIAEYYLNTAEENGSWYLVRSEATGKNLTENFISPLEHVVPFLMALYERTGDERLKAQCDRSVEYVIKTQYAAYNWEGQFEDSPLSTNYHNLTHYGAIALAKYYATYRKDDETCLETAKELMRFAEDQFVLWKRPYPWAHNAPRGMKPYDTSVWHTPSALEQYNWYVPIDASTSNLALGFLTLYKAGCGELYLAKARALTDQLTNMQHEDGQIPTHWMLPHDADWNFWFNCMFFSCRTLDTMSEYEK